MFDLQFPERQPVALVSSAPEFEPARNSPPVVVIEIFVGIIPVLVLIKLMRYPLDVYITMGRIEGLQERIHLILRTKEFAIIALHQSGLRRKLAKLDCLHAISLYALVNLFLDP
jgi:hypothetical protein